MTNRSYKYDPNLDYILAVIGTRRVGKIYFMFQIIEELCKKEKKADFVFVNFEDYRFIGFKSENFGDIIDAHYELYGKKPKYLFFDEIQNVKEYGKALLSSPYFFEHNSFALFVGLLGI